MRRLVEQTVLTYGEIAAKTGVGRAEDPAVDARRQMAAPAVWASGHTRASERASAKLKLRTLFARLAALAERSIRELEAAASVDPDKSPRRWSF